MRLLSSLCVTDAMKLPPTRAIVLPSSDARRGPCVTVSTAVAGTGESTSNVASAGAAGSRHIPSRQVFITAPATAQAVAATTVSISFFMCTSPRIDKNGLHCL
ncbi:MAG: hypothetical protein IJ173_03005 [Kiritimatiellae bacterium]|nr:hypothetical protein [Kiritimatiellia bacterium]